MRRTAGTSTPNRARRAIPALAALLLLPGVGRADEPSPSGTCVTYRVQSGETRVGDAYLWAKTIAIDGTHRGDLTGGATSIQISGLLTGDLQVAGQTVHIDGTVEDSARVIAQSVQINGTIEGDLVVFADSLFVGPRAHVTDRLFFVGRQMTMDGTVDGAVNATGGEISLAGTVGGSVKLRAESITFTPGATIGGDLDYSAREELAPDARPVVAGQVHYEPRHDDEDDEEPSSGLGSVLWWMWSVCASFLVGLVGVTLFRSVTTEIAATVGREWALSLGSGFITFIVVPVVGTLACIFIVTIPLMMLAFVAYLALLYIAKLPVGMWLGGRVLRLLGRAAPSPIASLAIGLPLLYLIFEIPVLGFFAGVGSLCVGLGAITLGTRQHIRSRRPLVAPVSASGG